MTGPFTPSARASGAHQGGLPRARARRAAAPGRPGRSMPARARAERRGVLGARALPGERLLAQNRPSCSISAGLRGGGRAGAAGRRRRRRLGRRRRRGRAPRRRAGRGCGRSPPPGSRASPACRAPRPGGRAGRAATGRPADLDGQLVAVDPRDAVRAGPERSLVAKLPSVHTSAGRISGIWRNRWGSQDADLGRAAGSRLPGGRHLRTLAMKTSSRRSPIPSRRLVSSLPDCAHERDALAVLVVAGGLAHEHHVGVGSPLPTTTWVRPSLSGQRVQPTTSSRW